MGLATGGIERIVASVRDQAFIFNIKDGAIEHIIVGDRIGRHVGELKGHTKSITALALFETTLYTGSADEEIRAWNLMNGKEAEPFHRFTGHDSTVWR